MKLPHHAFEPEAEPFGERPHRRVVDVGRELDAVRALLLEQPRQQLRHRDAAESSAAIGLVEQVDPQLEHPGRQAHPRLPRLHFAGEPPVHLDPQQQLGPVELAGAIDPLGELGVLGGPERIREPLGGRPVLRGRAP